MLLKFAIIKIQYDRQFRQILKITLGSGAIANGEPADGIPAGYLAEGRLLN